LSTWTGHFGIAVENGITVYGALYIAQAIAHRAERF